MYTFYINAIIADSVSNITTMTFYLYTAVLSEADCKHG